MLAVKRIVKEELSGWKAWEVTWLAAACAIVIGVSIHLEDTVMGIISSTTGIACVVCTGKGKLSAYIFGLVNSILYAIIAYQATLYGETMLNAIYYVPMQFVGFFIWSRHMDADTKEVAKRHMKWWGRLLMVVAVAGGTYLYGLLLRYWNDAIPFVDAFTTVSSIVAMIISVWMFSEQWWIWVAVDIFTVYMWWMDYSGGSGNIATLLMWIVYLGNAIIMLVKWEKEVYRRR